jgi:hypothetical protein
MNKVWKVALFRHTFEGPTVIITATGSYCGDINGELDHEVTNAVTLASRHLRFWRTRAFIVVVWIAFRA